MSEVEGDAYEDTMKRISPLQSVVRSRDLKEVKYPAVFFQHTKIEDKMSANCSLFVSILSIQKRCCIGNSAQATVARIESLRS